MPRHPRAIQKNARTPGDNALLIAGAAGHIARSALVAFLIFGAWTKPAAAMGDVAAEALAVSAFKGDTVALKRLEGFANHGDATAQDWLGAYDQLTHDATHAAFWYEKAAKQGNVTAQNNLGTLYANGVGVPKNPRKAAYWYKKAADQGNATAQNNLGIQYQEGQGVARNARVAADWFSKAANQGNAQAQYNLSVLYAHGDGRPRSLVISYALYLLATRPAPTNGPDRAGPSAHASVPGMTEQQVEAAQALEQRMRAIGVLKSLAAKDASAEKGN